MSVKVRMFFFWCNVSFVDLLCGNISYWTARCCEGNVNHRTYMLMLKGQREPQRKHSLAWRYTSWLIRRACSSSPLIAVKVAKGLFHCCQKKCSEISQDSWQSAALWTAFLLHLLLVFLQSRILTSGISHPAFLGFTTLLPFVSVVNQSKIKYLKAQCGTFLGTDWHLMELKIHISV